MKSASFLLLLLTTPALANVKAGGYLKDFWQYSRSALDGRPYSLNTARARLSLDADKAPFKAHADYDQQIAAGSFFRTREFSLFGYAPPEPWLNMNQTLSTGTTNGWGHGAYRAWLGVEDDRSSIRVGRQRIAWGTGKLWNPTDVLNPYDPTSIERDERRGVDALYARTSLGALSQVELAWAPRDNWADHSLLARAHANWKGWDASLLGGKIPGSTSSIIVGADFAGALLEGAAHGELAWFNPINRAPYWKFGLGYDYNFSGTQWTWLKDAAVVLEFYRAGNGTTDPRRYDFAALRAGREPGVAQNYAGASFSQDLHPLMKFECAFLVNADDGSTFTYPSLSWNALSNLWLTVAWQRFSGGEISEFGRQPNQIILSAQYWF